MNKFSRYPGSGFISTYFPHTPRILLRTPEYASLPDEGLHNLITFCANVYHVNYQHGGLYPQCP